MATNPVLVYREGKLELPEELRQEWHLHEGAEVRIVYSAGGRILLDTAPSPDSSVNWRNLEGSLSHLFRSPNEDLEEDRLRELALDARL